VASQNFDLGASAREEMLQHGFRPDFPPEVGGQLASMQGAVEAFGVDLRHLLWSSIDNSSSKDLDQIEWAERTGDDIRVLVAIADVDALVAPGSPI
jgi:exoribonuclease-2